MNRSSRQKHAEPPESDIQAAVLKYLVVTPLVAWAQRFNTGAHVIESRKANGGKSRRFVHYAFPGCSDILGQLADGRFLAVECKSRRGRLTAEQATFLETVNRAGGLGIVARCVEDVQDELFDDQRQRRKSA